MESVASKSGSVARPVRASRWSMVQASAWCSPRWPPGSTRSRVAPQGCSIPGASTWWSRRRPRAAPVRSRSFGWWPQALCRSVHCRTPNPLRSSRANLIRTPDDPDPDDPDPDDPDPDDPDPDDPDPEDPDDPDPEPEFDETTTAAVVALPPDDPFDAWTGVAQHENPTIAAMTMATARRWHAPIVMACPGCSARTSAPPGSGCRLRSSGRSRSGAP